MALSSIALEIESSTLEVLLLSRDAAVGIGSGVFWNILTPFKANCPFTAASLILLSKISDIVSVELLRYLYKLYMEFSYCFCAISLLSNNALFPNVVHNADVFIL